MSYSKSWVSIGAALGFAVAGSLSYSKAVLSYDNLTQISQNAIPEGKDSLKSIDKALAEGVQVGNMAPNFELRDLEGKLAYNLHSYDQPIVLNFWETWCPYCRSENPSMQEFSRVYEGRAVVLTVTKDDAKNTKTYMGKNSFDFIVLRDDSNVFQKYQIDGVPTTLILDKDKKIVFRNSGARDFMDPEGEIRKTIDGLLPKR